MAFLSVSAKMFQLNFGSFTIRNELLILFRPILGPCRNLVVHQLSPCMFVTLVFSLPENENEMMHTPPAVRLPRAMSSQ